MSQKRLLISGRVQGVFFRASTRETAKALGVKGYARNLPDGRVEVIAEAPSEVMEKFIAWCHQGPEAAEITAVSISDIQDAGPFSDFAIR